MNLLASCARARALAFLPAARLVGRLAGVAVAPGVGTLWPGRRGQAAEALWA